MKYYKILYDYEHSKGAILGKDKDIKGLGRYDVEEGKELSIDGQLLFELDIDGDNGNIATDYFINVLSWFIVSERTKEIFEKFQKEGLQFIPILITNEDKLDINNKYFIVNILNIENVIDLDNSLYNVFELDDGEKVVSITKYAIYEDRVKSKIFRLFNDTHPVFISEDLMKAMKDAKLSGFDFLELKKHKKL